MTETVIRSDAQLATLIAVFETEPDKQEELVSVLTEGIEKVIRHRPGFVSATIHASKDGARVVNYAQWSGPADVQAAFADPEVQEYAKKAAALGTPAPGVYDVKSVTLAP